MEAYGPSVWKENRYFHKVFFTPAKQLKLINLKRHTKRELQTTSFKEVKVQPQGADDPRKGGAARSTRGGQKRLNKINLNKAHTPSVELINKRNKLEPLMERATELAFYTHRLYLYKRIRVTHLANYNSPCTKLAKLVKCMRCPATGISHRERQGR